jgi:hypothetical protein
MNAHTFYSDEKQLEMTIGDGQSTSKSQEMLDCMVCALSTTDAGTVELTIWGDDEVVSVELSRKKAALVAFGIAEYVKCLK